MKDRNNQCECGSTLKCLEPDNDGKMFVICIGIGCDKKWELRREEDKQLPLFQEMADIYNG